MSTSDTDAHSPVPVYLLRGAAALFALLGAATAAWLIDKALRYPSVRAVQGSAEAPLWIPFTLFVVACTVTAIYLFLKAARRLSDDGRETMDNHR